MDSDEGALMEELLDFVDEDADDKSTALTRLRYRPGNRFVPSFVDLVDVGCDVFHFGVADGATGWCRHEAYQRGGDEIMLNVAYRAQGDDVTASAVWDSAVVLARYLVTHREQLVLMDRIVELGAGTGLAGLVAGRLVRSDESVSLILTDLASSLPRLKHNVDLNPCPGVKVTVQELVWGTRSLPSELVDSSPQTHCLVLAADCLLPYSDGLMGDLADTLSRLLQSASSCSFALVAYEERCDVSIFFAYLEKQHLLWHLVSSFDNDTLKILRVACKEGC